MEYTGTGRPNPARTASYKAFDVSDFSIHDSIPKRSLYETFPAKVS